MMAALGRLPPLQSIGKSQCVELENPPDLSDSEVDRFLAEYSGKEAIYYYEPEHAEAAEGKLGHVFQVLNPGKHVRKRTPEQAPGFTHCKHGVAFATKYGELRHLLETRAKLRLVRDYTSRVNAAAMFVRDVEAVAREEYRTWWAICLERLTEVPTSKVECLSAICEDLRVHMNHWNSVKQLTQTDPWLRQMIPSLSLDMEAIRRKLFQLRDDAIWWIDRLIHVGFRVLAHCDIEHFTQDSLWSAVRGLEDFNTIVAAVKLENVQEGHQSAHNSIVDTPSAASSSVSSSSSHLIPRQLEAWHTNSYKNLAASVKPVPFVRVLNLLACERSKFAACATHQFLAGGKELLQLVLEQRLEDYSWAETLCGPDRRGAGRGLGGDVAGETSDYHSASGSHLSLGTAMLRVGGLVAPDLSREPSPLVDFSRREQNFASKFLQIVCHSTSLLKKPSSVSASPTNVAGRDGQRQQQPDNNNGNSRDAARPPRPPAKSHARNLVRVDPDGPTVSVTQGDLSNDGAATAGAVGAGTTITNTPPPQRSGSKTTTVTIQVETQCSKRKSVSWGDAAEVSLAKQLSQRYMEMLWQFFGPSLAEQLQAPCWGGAETARGQLGSVLLCPDIVIQLLLRMMQQSCAKDMFPSGAVVPVRTICQRLHVTTAWATWHTGFCRAAASAVSDKCYPVLLADGLYSTRTAKYLRDTFAPMQSALVSLQPQEHGNGLPANNGNKMASAALVRPTVLRLALSCQLSAIWCQTKANQLLASWALGAFQLVTHSDLRMLADEVRQSVRIYKSQQDVSRENPDNPADNEVHGSVVNMIANVDGQLQTLSGAMVKQFTEKFSAHAQEFFEDEMPVGKPWRRKIHQEAPTRHNDYVAHALDTLIEPVVAGVSKLRATSQLGAVSMAVTAMCEAWTDFILKQKVRFSVLGAQQLHLDFDFVQTWLATCLQNDEVRHSILSLDIFKYLKGIVGLLERQPRGRSVSRSSRERRHVVPAATSLDARVSSRGIFLKDGKAQRLHVDHKSPISVGTSSPDSSWRTMTCETTATTLSESETTVTSENDTATASSEDRSAESSRVTSASTNHRSRRSQQEPHATNGKAGDSDGEEFHYKMPKMEQWLALRVHGGARNWPRLPSCFNNPQP